MHLALTQNAQDLYILFFSSWLTYPISRAIKKDVTNYLLSDMRLVISVYISADRLERNFCFQTMKPRGLHSNVNLKANLQGRDTLPITESDKRSSIRAGLIDRCRWSPKWHAVCNFHYSVKLKQEKQHVYYNVPSTCCMLMTLRQLIYSWMLAVQTGILFNQLVK